jgi:hypothetical protein
MNKVDNLVTKIRDLINHPWKQNSLLKDKDWNILCACLDAIEDTEMAIDEYETANPESLYLPIYGLLQALFLQGDALSNLNNALFKEKIDFKNDYYALYQVRETRNASIGHPTHLKRDGRDIFFVINRSSIKKYGFELVRYELNHPTEFISINLRETTKDQSDCAIQILSKVVSLLEKEFETHKEKFKNDKLVDLISPNFNYYISKLYEAKKDTRFAESSLELIKETLDKIINQVSLRYGEKDGFPDGLALTIEDLEFILKRIAEFFTNIHQTDARDIDVYIHQLRSKFKELQSMLIEIDEDFSVTN